MTGGDGTGHDGPRCAVRYHAGSDPGVRKRNRGRIGDRNGTVHHPSQSTQKAYTVRSTDHIVDEKDHGRLGPGESDRRQAEKTVDQDHVRACRGAGEEERRPGAADTQPGHRERTRAGR